MDSSIESVTLRALSGLGEFDLVTCYRGEAIGPPEAQQLAERIGQQIEDIEVEVVVGGQRHDHLLVAVE